MANERNLTIISHKKGFFDFAPFSNIMLDGVYVGKLDIGGKFTIKLDNNPHTVRCEFRYGKNNEKTESSNSISLKSGLDYVLILKPIADTFGKQFKEDLWHMFSKGYVGVREIELVEDENQAAINRKAMMQQKKENTVKEETNSLWDQMSQY